MGGVSRYSFACIGVRGRLDSPDTKGTKQHPIFEKIFSDEGP